VTKSALVTRDLDILGPMAAKGLATVGVSVTTLDAELAQNMEPRAARPERRLETIRMLAAAGLPVTVVAPPMIPALNDHELEAILIRARQAGATHASYILLHLPLKLKNLFEEWLSAYYPDRKRRVLSRLREMRGGELCKSRHGERMRGGGKAAAGTLPDRGTSAGLFHGADVARRAAVPTRTPGCDPHRSVESVC
jgi:DNA repair photolyase